jgi:metallo-beta-lactamase class B
LPRPPPFGQPAASQASDDAHIAAATPTAGSDLSGLLGLSKPPRASLPPQAEIDKGIAALINKPVPPPGQAFDNLFYVGPIGSAREPSRPRTAPS